MKKALLALAVTAVTAAALPALAQDYDGPRHREAYRDYRDDQRPDFDRDRGGDRWGGGSISARLDRIAMRIREGRMNGSLTRSEARELRGRLQAIEAREMRYRQTGGLSGWERDDLQQRVDRLAMQVRYETRDREYGYGYGEVYRSGDWADRR